ncbi:MULTISPECIES: hypothetical protein [unclassified Sphingomonas]|uniref:hypothetical protein n=1 Tax=unclassified Sphingomonas TaxID=196159 RepID=UPI00226ADB4A|nr:MULTISPECIES: hypothetical protein [unclassified Sphingomonas]
MNSGTARPDDDPIRAERSWADQADYHRRRAEQEALLAERTTDPAVAAAHQALAERHNNLAAAAEIAGTLPDSAKPVPVEQDELVARAVAVLTPKGDA